MGESRATASPKLTRRYNPHADLVRRPATVQPDVGRTSSPCIAPFSSFPRRRFQPTVDPTSRPNGPASIREPPRPRNRILGATHDIGPARLGGPFFRAGRRPPNRSLAVPEEAFHGNALRDHGRWLNLRWTRPAARQSVAIRVRVDCLARDLPVARCFHLVIRQPPRSILGTKCSSMPQARGPSMSILVKIRQEKSKMWRCAASATTVPDTPRLQITRLGSSSKGTFLVS